MTTSQPNSYRTSEDHEHTTSLRLPNGCLQKLSPMVVQAALQTRSTQAGHWPRRQYPATSHEQRRVRMAAPQLGIRCDGAVACRAGDGFPGIVPGLASASRSATSRVICSHRSDTTARSASRYRAAEAEEPEIGL